MPFESTSSTIQEGDLVIVWMKRDQLKPITVQKGEQLNSRFGVFPHDLMIGSDYGTQMASSTAQGFVHLLKPTPELWTRALPHRTQIVYTPDASYIIQRLKILPGSRVIEAGTGSGSFTHTLARSVGKTGKLYTFEFHEPRYHAAREEITNHGLENVTVTHRDVCDEGFNVESEHMRISSVFLDLPAPWEAIPHVQKVADRSRAVSICCFSPCIEQVLRTVETLRCEGFVKVEMVEVAARNWEVHKSMVRSIDDELETLRDVKRRRVEGIERRRLRKELEAAKELKAAKELEAAKENESGKQAENSGTEIDDGEKLEQQTLQKRRADEDDNKDGTELHSREQQDVKQKFNPWGRGLKVREGDPPYEWLDVSRMESEIKSHTSYLTFALLPPSKDFKAL